LSTPASIQPQDLQPAPGAVFATTRWSVVLSAQGKTSIESDQALEILCRTYWYPLYAYVRRRGIGPHDAQDLTQEFFARLLHKDYLQTVDREKGRFRSFLIVALQRFLANEHDRAIAQKRGGGHLVLSLDAELAERRYQNEPTAAATSPDQVYERRWALTLLERAMTALRGEFAEAGKTNEFNRLKSFLTAGSETPSYAEIAQQIGIREGAVRVAVHRLRKRFRELFRDEILQTVARPEDVEDEIRHLLTALAQ
jgi:RNA polymerase sigma-70 factor (ECF subfamily)